MAGRTSQQIKFEKDTLQPHKKNGDVNEDFIKVYGAKAHPNVEVQEHYK